MKVKGVRQLRSLTLDTSTLTAAARQRLSERIGDMVIAELPRRQEALVGKYISDAYTAYLRAVADYLGKKGDRAFAIPGGLSKYRSTEKGRGFIRKRRNPIPTRLPATSVDISFTLPLPGKGGPGTIAFTTTFAGLAKRTVENKLFGPQRYWKQSGETLRVIGSELQGIARTAPAKVVVMTTRRIPIQPDLRPQSGKPVAKFQMVMSVRLKAPRDPAWAEVVTESFASGVLRSGFDFDSAFGDKPIIRSLFNEVGFTGRTGTPVEPRAFIQEMGIRAGRALFQRLQQVKT